MASKCQLRGADAAATGSDSSEEDDEQQQEGVLSSAGRAANAVVTLEPYGDGEGDSEESTVVVTVPPLEKTVFPSWEAFHAYLAEYQKRTFQIYSTRTVTPVTTRNKRIQETYKLTGVPPGKLLPEEMGTYSKAVVCTHYGRPRSKSTGVRPRRSRAINCGAQITAVLRRDEASGQCFVHVSSHRTRHNHALSDGLYRKYPRVRKITDPSVLRTVQALHRAGVKAAKILEYVRENTDKQVVAKDVHNLLAAMRKGPPLPPPPPQPTAPLSQVPPPAPTPANRQLPTQYGKFLASFNVSKQVSELLAEMDADRFAHCYAELGMFLRIAESGRLPIVTTREAMNHTQSHVLAGAWRASSSSPAGVGNARSPDGSAGED